MRIVSFLRYMLFSRHRHGHGIHSPFVFDLVTKVINPDITQTIPKLEEYRKKCKRSKEKIFIQELGTGPSGFRNIASIASRSLATPRECTLLNRMINHFQPAACIELGTSLGITTAYMAYGMKNKPVFTIEGNHETAKLAQQLFEQDVLHHVQLKTGDISEVLPQILPALPHPFLAFIDANHSFQPTLDYVGQLLKFANSESIIIIHDIHLNAEMEKAWNKICQIPSATFTIDLFTMGLVFFNKKSPKQHFVIRF